MPTPEPRFPARFDSDTWNTDLARSTAAGRSAGEAARRKYEPGGVPVSHLKPCQAEGPRGINLPDCAKVYVPHPNGKWGIVFEAIVADGHPRLDFIAFGVRHHPKGSHALTVYDYADERVDEIPARDLRGEEPEAPEAGAEAENTPGN